MKRNLTFALLALVIGACSSDSHDNSQSELKKNLAAKWGIQEITYYQGLSEFLSDCEKQSHWTFGLDNKLYIREFSDKKGTPCTDLNPNNYWVNYSLSDNTIAYTAETGGLNGSPYTARYKINRLTPTTLKLTAVYEVDGITAGHHKYAEAPFEGDIPVEHQWTFTFNKSAQEFKRR